MAREVETEMMDEMMDATSEVATPRSPRSADYNPPADGIELSVIVPTFNEIKNVDEMVRRLERCLTGVARWEVIFVDDNSPDGTAEAVRHLAARDQRVRCLQRIGRRGLSSACIEGFLASAAPYIAVIDGDLQHDETILPAMLRTLREDHLDIVVGSRYVCGGGIGTWQKSRASMSRFATKLSRIVLHGNLADPMSGFFMMTRATLADVLPRLSGIGFKILVDLFASASTPLRFRELPYEFRDRQAGESKLDNQAVWDYLMLIADKRVGRFIPVRFIAFTLVGGVGVFVHLAVLSIAFGPLHASFQLAQTEAALAAMTTNLFFNNVLTYRDRQLRGWGLLRGWASFVLACSIGAVANVGISGVLYGMQFQWVLSALAGILIGAVWNYAVTAL
jgi:dolichol-phosphate mannosyltransferase